MGMIMFYVTFPDKSAAESLSNVLVKEKLVACSNIHPVESSYHWQAAYTKEYEYVAIYKTSFANIWRVESKIEELHPYQVPCILHWEFSCNLAYEKWLRQNIEE